MSTPSKLNKENFRLLDISSEEDSEDLHLDIIPSRKKKITRYLPTYLIIEFKSNKTTYQKKIFRGEYNEQSIKPCNNLLFQTRA